MDHGTRATNVQAPSNRPSRTGRKALACAWTLIFACTLGAHAQNPRFRTESAQPRDVPGPTINEPVPDTGGQQYAPSATDKVKPQWPKDAFQTDPEVGVRQRAVFRDTGAPHTNMLRPISVNPTVHQGSVDAGVFVDLPDVRGRFPLLDRGFEPQDADLKIGPVFFKLRALSGAALFSDNINHSEIDRESDIIGITRIAGTVYVQIAEGVQASASGNFTYLPFEGKGGFAGFPVLVPYSIGLDGRSLAEAQIAWDTMIAGWNVIFADDFRMGIGRLAYGARDDFDLFEGGDFNDADRAGRYVFRGNGNSRGSPDADFDERDDLDPLYYSNTVSALTERLIPGPARLRVRAYHTDLWYNQGNRGNPGLRGNDRYANPRTVDGLTATITSERDNMRFQPYLRYSALKTNNFDSFNHEIRLGIEGPITDQVHYTSNVGLHYTGDTGDTRWVWGTGITHLAGPYTRQSLHAESYVLELAELFVNQVTYRFSQVLGPKLSFDAYASYGTIEDLDVEEQAREMLRLGARLTVFAGPRTVIRAGYTLNDLDSTGGLRYAEDFDRDPFDYETLTHTFRLEMTYRFTDMLQSRLLYQYQDRNSNRRGLSYEENLLFLSFTKYFD